MRLKLRRAAFNIILGLIVLAGIFYLQLTEMKFNNAAESIFSIRHGNVEKLPQMNVHDKVKFNDVKTTKETERTPEIDKSINQLLTNKPKEPGDETAIGMFTLLKHLYQQFDGKTKHLNLLTKLITNPEMKFEVSGKHLKYFQYVLEQLDKNTQNSSQNNALENVIENLYVKFLTEPPNRNAKEPLNTASTKGKLIVKEIDNIIDKYANVLNSKEHKNIKETVEKQMEKTNEETKPTEKPLDLVFEKEFSDEELLELHYKIRNFTSDSEVEEFYARDERTVNKFSRPVDINNIRNYVKDLFPQADRPEDDRILAQLHLKLVNTTTKIIHVRGGKATQQELDKRECNINNCIVTRDTTKYSKPDAVLFGTSVVKKARLKMHEDEVWIFSNLESPLNSGGGGKYANWSETYRRDSVVVAPYERFTTFPQYKTLPEKPLENFAGTKKKLVAWFVSNCHAANNRDGYAKELKKYIPVDIYGRCGDKKCSRRNKECFRMLKTDYKFYLSFENSNCKDYITEKLYWNAYQNDVLPIVMGAHPNSYKIAAPPRSFLHVDMFTSPKQLAEYLLFLDKNDDLYNSFFLWRGTGDYIDTKSICRLCAMVHVAPFYHTWYDHPRDWWSGGHVCRRRQKDELIPTWKENNVPIL